AARTGARTSADRRRSACRRRTGRAPEQPRFLRRRLRKRESPRCDFVSLDCLLMMACAVEMNDGAVAVGCLSDRGLVVSDESVQVLGPVGQSPEPQPLDGPSLAVLRDTTPCGEKVI